MACHVKSNIVITLIISSFVFACAIKGKSNGYARTSTEKKHNAGIDSIDLRVLCAVGMRQVILDILPKFERATRYRVAVDFTSSGEIVKLLGDDKPVDVVIIFRP